jgi:hypothetical protein
MHWNREHRFFACLLLSVALCSSLRSSTTPNAQQFPSQALVAIRGEDLPGKYNNVEISDFAISPDNTKIAVGFEVGEGDKKLGAWLGEWEITTKKLVATAHLPHPVSEAMAFVALHHETMEYTPDGSAIIFLAGSNLYGFDSATLNLRYSISATEGAEISTSEMYEQRFSISPDGSTLAVLIGQSYDPPRRGSIGLYKTNNGEQVGLWPLSVPIRSLSLSADGKQLLISILNPKNATDILLFDSMTGRQIRSFESGFGTQQLVGAALNAVFVDADRFIVTPGSSINAKGQYLGHALRIFDSHTGKVTGELTYEKLGPSADLWVSNKDATLATLNLWMPQWRRRSIEASPKHAQFLFFRLNETNPFCVLGPLPEKSDERPRQSGFIRLSPDLGLIGLFMNRQVTVYSRPECNERGKAQAVKNGAAVQSDTVDPITGNLHLTIPVLAAKLKQ